MGFMFKIFIFRISTMEQHTSMKAEWYLVPKLEEKY